jgi:hypothetical protein
MKLFGDDSAVQLLGPMSFDFATRRVYIEAVLSSLKKTIQQASKQASKQTLAIVTSLSPHLRISNSPEHPIVHSIVLSTWSRKPPSHRVAALL